VTMPGTDVQGSAGASAGGPGAEAPDVATLSFDEALAELQRTVATLEQGGLPLERTLDLYERGAALHARCAMLLDEAELRIRRLAAGPGGKPVLVDEPAAGDPAAGASGELAEDE
jgi:exodeoxyribonuclease VII small subunit